MWGLLIALGVVGYIVNSHDLVPNARGRTPIFWFSRRVGKGDKRGKRHAKMEQSEMVRKLKSMGVRAEAKVSSGKRGKVFQVRSGPLGKKSAAVKRAMAAIQRKHFR